jgi:hypothetical protein
MNAAVGFLQAGAVLGRDAILVRPKRSIGDFTAQVTIEESHQDDLEITDHPVELGAKITDHAYKLPSQLVIKCGWSNSPTPGNFFQSLKNAVTGTIAGVKNLTGNGPSAVKEVYANFLKLQADRTLVDVYTGKRVYTNMLVKGLHTQTDIDTENSLILTVTLRQVIIVSTRTLTLASTSIASDPAKLKSPEKNAVPANSGAKQLVPGTSYNGG